MIAPEFEDYLMKQMTDHLITPMTDLGLLIDTHSLAHAKLLMSENNYPKVPVIDRQNHFKGNILLSDIIRHEMTENMSDLALSEVTVSDLTREVSSLKRSQLDVTTIMHQITDRSFIAVVDDKDETLIGIIRRKAVLRDINAFLHTFAGEYDIVKHD